MAQKEPLKKIPSTQAKATNLVAKSACSLFIHLNAQFAFSLTDGKDFKISKSNTTLSDREKSLIANLFSNIGIGGVNLN